MGLFCSVYELSVDGITSEDVPGLLQLLEDLSPQMVALDMDLSTFQGPEFENFLQTVIQLSNYRCTHLSLRIRLGKPEVMPNIEEFMVNTPITLS